MKILLVSTAFKPSWETGGTTRVVYEISNGLSKKGHDVTVYTTDRGPKRLKITKNKILIVDDLKVYYFRNISNYLATNFNLITPYYLPIVARNDVKNFDIIHIHEHRTLAAVIISYFAKKYGIPYIVQSHGSVLPFFQKKIFKKIFDKLWGYNILFNAFKLIALTTNEFEQYKKMGLKEKKIEILSNGINLSEYKNLPKKGEFKRKYNIKDDQKIILYLGRIHKIKGIDLLIEAFNMVLKQLDNVKLVIVGPDSGFLNIIKNLSRKMGIDENVLFTGPLYDTDKLEAYVDADLYVLPSFYETFPNTVIEACACDTPIIITERCGISDIIDNNVGYVVKFEKNDLKNGIINLLTNDEIYEKFRRNCFKLVEKEFDLEKTILKLEKIYGINRS